MNKNVIIFIILFFCIIIVAAFSFVINRYESNNNFLTETISGKYWLEFESNNQTFFDCILQQNGNNLDSLFLHEIVGNTPKLFLRFKETNCNVCIENELENLIKLASKVDTNNIILLGSFTNSRARWMRKSSFKIFNIGNQELGLSLDKENMPYYFILNKDFSAKSVFIPFKEFPGLTDKYFELIKRKYFNQVH